MRTHKILNVHDLTVMYFSVLIFVCLDKECEMGTSGCEHICQNTPQAYYCKCEYGYTLRPDLHTCQGELF